MTRGRTGGLPVPLRASGKPTGTTLGGPVANAVREAFYYGSLAS